MTWRLANSLRALRLQIDERYPKRDKSWDGSIGDEHHASRSSDHNPWVDGGVVTAIDITHDPKGGVDSYKLAEELRLNRDARIKYIISNGRICSSKVSPWTWRPYHGSSKHDHHVHVSVESSRVYYDDVRPWSVPMLGTAPAHTLEEVAKASVPAEKRDQAIAQPPKTDPFEQAAQKVERDDV